jgi:hypothetical protein
MEAGRDQPHGQVGWAATSPKLFFVDNGRNAAILFLQAPHFTAELRWEAVAAKRFITPGQLLELPG